MAADAWLNFWRARSPRERGVLAVGAGILSMALAYGLLLDPMLAVRAKLEMRLPMMRAETRLMQAQVAAIERERVTAANPSGPASLVGRVGVSAESAGVRAKLREIVPIGDDQVRVDGVAVPVRELVSWLGDLDRQGLRVVHCLMASTDSPGAVTLSMRVQGAAP